MKSCNSLFLYFIYQWPLLVVQVIGVHAYRVGGKYQSNGIRYRYRRTHIGTLNLIIFMSIELTSHFACCGYLWYFDSVLFARNRCAEKFLTMSNIGHLAKDRQSIKCLLWYPCFFFFFESTMLHIDYTFNDTILSVYFNKFSRITFLY